MMRRWHANARLACMVESFLLNRQIKWGGKSCTINTHDHRLRWRAKHAKRYGAKTSHCCLL